MNNWKFVAAIRERVTFDIAAARRRTYNRAARRAAVGSASGERPGERGRRGGGRARWTLDEVRLSGPVQATAAAAAATRGGESATSRRADQQAGMCSHQR